MKDKLIQFSTAKLAKQKGFNIETQKYWANYYTGEPLMKWKLISKEDKTMEYMEWAAPTQSLLQRWLREEHNLHVDMYRNAIGFQCNLDKAGCGTHIRKVTDCEEDTYEQALEKGIQEALKLIKKK